MGLGSTEVVGVKNKNKPIITKESLIEAWRIGIKTTRCSFAHIKEIYNYFKPMTLTDFKKRILPFVEAYDEELDFSRGSTFYGNNKRYGIKTHRGVICYLRILEKQEQSSEEKSGQKE